MKYNELPYKRVSLEESESYLNELLPSLESEGNLTAQINAVDSMNQFKAELSSYEAIASLNFNRNTRDESAKSEKEYYDDLGPGMKELENKFTKAILNSSELTGLKEKYGEHYFNLKEVEEKTFDPAIKEMLHEETKMENEYTSIIAGAEIDFGGKTYNLAGLGPFHQDLDRNTRKDSYHARFSFFEKNSEKLDDLYDRMVKLRHKIAVTLGYENFVQLGYMRLGRTDYGPEEVKAFRDQIVQEVVPLASKLNEQRRENLGLDKMYFYDTIHFADGNPKPKGTPDELVKHAQTMYKELSPETDEFFSIMVNEDLLDLVNRDGKMAGGFCTSFPKYERPYIFSNFNGTDHDVTVLTHEAGHAFQCYSSRKQPLVEYLWPTLEACEIHSMSMEFLTWPWMELFFREDKEKFLLKHVTDSLCFLPYGACVDHFQHWVYENPEASPADRKAKWSELEKIYLPDRNYDDLSYPLKGGIWQGQLHIYQMPFYYIDYTLAQTCAFQFWIKADENREQAWQDYLRLCKVGGSMPFTQLVDVANIKSPFIDGTLKQIAGHVYNWLECRKQPV